LLELVRLGERERLGRDRDRRAQVRAARRRYRIDRKRVFVAGMSAGGGLPPYFWGEAAELSPELFIHSGGRCGAASSGLAALKVLKARRRHRCRRDCARCSRQGVTTIAASTAARSPGAPMMTSSRRSMRAARPAYLVLNGPRQPMAGALDGFLSPIR